MDYNPSQYKIPMPEVYDDSEAYLTVANSAEAVTNLRHDALARMGGEIE